MKNKTMKRRAGFTLIELLVVIAIIITLASIGVVAYAQFQRRAAVAATKDMVNTLVTALNVYAVDNSSSYPAVPVSATDINTWFTTVNLGKYIGKQFENPFKSSNVMQIASSGTPIDISDTSTTPAVNFVYTVTAPTATDPGHFTLTYNLSGTTITLKDALQ